MKIEEWQEDAVVLEVGALLGRTICGDEWTIRQGLHALFSTLYTMGLLCGDEYAELSSLADDWAINGGKTIRQR